MGIATISALAAAIRNSPGGKVALDDGLRSVTYGELDSLIAQEGRWLAGCQGTRFALLADNCVGWAIADLALHLGSIFSVPLPGYFTAAQLLHALDDAGIDALLTDAPARIGELLQGWRLDSRSDRTGLSLFRRRLAPGAQPPTPAGTAKVTYTSGSTAKPKGVCLSAAQLETLAASLAAATASLAIQRHLCLLPLPTLLENIAGIYAPLLAGATCLVPPTTATGMRYSGPDPSLLLRAVAGSRPESLILVPELLRLLVAAGERGWQPSVSLKFIAVGGASVPLSLLERAAAVGLPVYEGYGLSECASVVCLNTPAARRAGSVGRPLPHARVRIDGDGQVLVSGVTMLGYLGDEPRDPGAELATGDLGECDADGYFHVRGRLRDMFITSLGRNVAPEWVEGEISQQPGIRHVMVLGEARPYAVALVSASPAEADTAAIERAIAAANARLPDYAQVRRWVRSPQPFSLANGLLTANGRLRRREITGRYGTLLDSLYRDEIAS
jgi:long-subunit acyl-CoA synthetase (AMP-forming)